MIIELPAETCHLYLVAHRNVITERWHEWIDTGIDRNEYLELAEAIVNENAIPKDMPSVLIQLAWLAHRPDDVHQTAFGGFADLTGRELLRSYHLKGG